MSVQDSINVWGRSKLAKANLIVPEGTHITLTEDLPSAYYCEACGPNPITVAVEGGGAYTLLYMSMGDIIREILWEENE